MRRQNAAAVLRCVQCGRSLCSDHRARRIHSSRIRSRTRRAAHMPCACRRRAVSCNEQRYGSVRTGATRVESSTLHLIVLGIIILLSGIIILRISHCCIHYAIAALEKSCRKRLLREARVCVAQLLERCAARLQMWPRRVPSRVHSRAARTAPADSEHCDRVAVAGSTVYSERAGCRPGGIGYRERSGRAAGSAAGM